jgi:hypothetical protein
MRPVVFIPGIGGSILVNKERPMRKVLHKEIVHNRWLNIYPYIPNTMAGWKYDMGCDVVRGENRRIVGVKPKNDAIHAYDVGGIQGIKDVLPEFLLLPASVQRILQDMFQFRYFHDACQQMMSAGYKEGMNMFGIPYDFRLVLDFEYRATLFMTMKQIIETACERNGSSDGCVIFAHSLGAILFKWFVSGYVSTQWMDKYIASMILISPPFAGSVVSLKTVLFGDFYVPQFHKLYKDELQVNTGIITCLPNIMGYSPYQPLVQIERENVNVSCNDYLALADAGHVSFEIWRDLYMPHISTIVSPVAGRSVVFHAKNRDTPYMLRTPDWDTYPTECLTKNGDGIISELDRSFLQGVFPNAEVYSIDAKHTDIIANPHVLAKLREETLIDSKLFKNF